MILHLSRMSRNVSRILFNARENVNATAVVYACASRYVRMRIPVCAYVRAYAILCEYYV